jgi:F0F1-type ATP synthase assembly protein I
MSEDPRARRGDTESGDAGGSSRADLPPDGTDGRDPDAWHRDVEELGARIREVKAADTSGMSAWERRRTAGRRGYEPGQISGQAWNTLGTLIAGTAVWAAIGFGIDRLAGTGMIFLPIGALVGMAGSLYLVIYRVRQR